MKTKPIIYLPHGLKNVDDEDLARLAMLWRTQALRGNRTAHKLACAFEAEQRKRYTSVEASVFSFMLLQPPKSDPSRRGVAKTLLQSGLVKRLQEYFQ